MPGTQRWNLAVAAIASVSGYSTLYAVGGYTASGSGLSTNQVYNARTNQWAYRAPLPGPRSGTNGIGVIKGKLYISGGFSGRYSIATELFVYNPATNTWAQTASLPHTTYGGFTGVISDKLYVLTGCADEDNCDVGSGLEPFVAFYRYDPATDQWTSLPIPPERHEGGVAGTISGKFYVVGGRTPVGDVTRQLHVYSPATNSWTAKAPMALPRWDAVGTAVDGKLYLVGGEQRNADGTYAQVSTTIVYNPATNSWVTKRAVPKRPDRAAAARVAVNGQSSLEIVGGARPGNNVAYPVSGDSRALVRR